MFNSSSSGNNCHAVQRSLSSAASVCIGKVEPSPCPILLALIRPRDLFRLLAIAFWGRVEGQNITLYGDRDETINPIISKWNKLVQKSTRLDMAKVIHRELCKKSTFKHSIKCYMHKRESILENEMHRILWDFDIQTDHLILSKRPDLLIIKKKREPAK